MDNSHHQNNHGSHNNCHGNCQNTAPEWTAEQLTDRVIYKARIFGSSEIELCVFADKATRAEREELIILNTRYGKDAVVITGELKERDDLESDKVKTVLRRATQEDGEKLESLFEKEETAFSVCHEKIDKHGLDMKLVSAHYLTDEPKIIFFFTADNRIDFRELVKDLVAVFRLRIELRQIGVRDEARVLGGLAVCGRDYCCHGITDKMVPVSIKMAKEQSLSLNSLKISGPCGRLLCCLSYEYQYYVDERKNFPAEGSRFLHDSHEYRVTEINVFARKIHLMGPEGRIIHVPADFFYYHEEGKEWRMKHKEMQDYQDASSLSK